MIVLQRKYHHLKLFWICRWHENDEEICYIKTRVYVYKTFVMTSMESTHQTKSIIWNFRMENEQKQRMHKFPTIFREMNDPLDCIYRKMRNNFRISVEFKEFPDGLWILGIESTSSGAVKNILNNNRVPMNKFSIW